VTSDLPTDGSAQSINEPLRPTKPDPSLVDAASANVIEVMGWSVGTDINWAIGDRIDRRNSSLFPLRTVGGPGKPVVAYYKVFLPPTRDPARGRRWATEVAKGLLKTEALDRELARLTQGHPIMISQTLAADASTLTQVTLGVDGTPLGKAWTHTLTPSRRSRIVESLSLVGRAAALIEQCSPDSVEVDASVEAKAVSNRIVRMERALEDSTLAALRRKMEELDAAAATEPGRFTHSHGDLSSTNVLLREAGIGLIDFSWLPRLRSFDVARFAFRLEYDTVITGSWADTLVGALLDGYGDAAVTERPNWLILRVPWLLKVVERGTKSRFGRHQARARRALAEIETIL
jgi:Phosphotransferase enzyme family